MILGISVTAVQKNIEYLKTIGCIESNKSGYWKVKDWLFGNSMEKCKYRRQVAIFEWIHIAYRIYEKDISTSSFSNKVVTFYLLHCQPHRSTKEVDFITLAVFGTCFLRQNYACGDYPHCSVERTSKTAKKGWKSRVLTDSKRSRLFFLCLKSARILPKAKKTAFTSMGKHIYTPNVLYR